MAEWHNESPDTSPEALIFNGYLGRSLVPSKTPMNPDNWLRLKLYPIARELGIPFNPTFQVLCRSFSTYGQEDMTPKDM